MKRIMLAMLATASVVVFGYTEIYRLERDTDTGSLLLVGADNVRRAVMLVSPEEYAFFTGRVDMVWQSLNSYEDGRRRLHGQVSGTVFTNGVKRVTYKDGYVHEQKTVVLNNSVRKEFRRVPERSHRPTRTSHFSVRHWEMKEAAEAAKTNAVKIVTVEHNAATGKDVVK